MVSYISQRFTGIRYSSSSTVTWHTSTVLVRVWIPAGWNDRVMRRHVRPFAFKQAGQDTSRHIGAYQWHIETYRSICVEFLGVFYVQVPNEAPWRPLKPIEAPPQRAGSTRRLKNQVANWRAKLPPYRTYALLYVQVLRCWGIDSSFRDLNSLTISSRDWIWMRWTVGLLNKITDEPLVR